MKLWMAEIDRLFVRWMPDGGMIDIIDVAKQLTSLDGKILEELFNERSYLNEKGYERIAEVYKKSLEN